MSTFPEALNKLWAGARSGVRPGILAVYEEVFAEFEMDEPLVIAHFMAQISHECTNGKITREDLSYTTVERLMEIFGTGRHSANVTLAEAPGLLRNPQKLAERVYGMGNPKKAKELGNLKPGDAYRFRGGGMLQLTGGANYKHISELTGIDVYNHPELFDDPKASFRIAAAEFAALGAIKWAKADNVLKVTLVVNGGKNGLAERTVNLRKWKQELDGVDAPAYAPRAAMLDAPPKLLETRTGQIGVATGALGTVTTVAQVGNAVSTINDSVTTVTETIGNAQGGIEQVQATVKVIKPFLGMSAHTWQMIGIGASAAVVAGIIAILIYRWIKIRNEGE